MTDRFIIDVRVVNHLPEVVAYDLEPGTSCSGVPTTCAPRWRVPIAFSPVGLVGADNVAIVGGAGGGSVTPSLVFRLDGVGCDPVTHTCPVITSFVFNHVASPSAVANGRIVFNSLGVAPEVWSVPN